MPERPGYTLILVVLVGLGMLVAQGPARLQGANLLADPGFAEGTTGVRQRFGGTFTVVTTPVHGDSHPARHQHPGLLFDSCDNG